MKSRLPRLAATAGATVLLAGFGAVAATSASAATKPAAVVTHTATVPMSTPMAAYYPAWWPWCEFDLLGPVVCVDI